MNGESVAKGFGFGKLSWLDSGTKIPPGGNHVPALYTKTRRRPWDYGGQADPAYVMGRGVG